MRPGFAAVLIAGLVLGGCAGSGSPEPRADMPEGPHVVALGTVQDGGLPHAGCSCERCEAAGRDPARARRIACLAIVLPESGRRFLIDATPDLREQLAAIGGDRAPGRVDRAPLDGLFLTHAHIGHYLGLAFFGFEAIHTRGLPVYVTPAFGAYLRENGPWSQLVDIGNVRLVDLAPRTPVELGDRVRIEAWRVPHRDEYADTVGFVVRGPTRAVLYVPDTDGWQHWDPPLAEQLEGIDVAILDGSFFSIDELPGRDLRDVPHPMIRDTMDRLQPLVDERRLAVRLTHLNHSNPALDPNGPEHAEIVRRGFAVLSENERIAL